MTTEIKRPVDDGGTSGTLGSRALGMGLLVVAAVLSASCATSSPTFEGDIVWEDDDRHPIEAPEPRKATKYWEMLDHTLFRPINQALELAHPEPAANVNALGEVPNSSWYTNRLSVRDLSPERVARGPCPEREWNLEGPLRVTRAEHTGHGLDFWAVAESTGQRYRLQPDRRTQPGRATTADIVGSRIYWAAGYETPCIRIAFVDDSEMTVDGDTIPLEDVHGHADAMPREDVHRQLEKVTRRRDGALRIAVSRPLPGRPLGPFEYAGTRRDDPNDVVPHQERRDVRGAHVFAAWINHFDVRQFNTASQFITEEGETRGYVQHFWTDFDDALGAVWFSDSMSRRFSHSYYVDLADVVVDFVTFGLVPRPWHKGRVGKPHDAFGYFRADNFWPRQWKPGFPNTAYQRMDRHDAAWAARIVSRFSEEHLEAIVERARLRDAADARYLVETLRKRRNRIVREYAEQVAPLAFPRTRGETLCVEDLLVGGGYLGSDRTSYRVRRKDGDWRRPDAVEAGRVCAQLSGLEVGNYLVVEVQPTYEPFERQPASTRFHLRRTSERFKVVGIVR